MRDDNKLGVWMCAALVVGSMIGTGIFMIPANLAPYGVGSSLLAWAVSATGAILLAGVFSGLGRAFPEAEGPYAYTRMAFGDLTAFIAAWAYWISLWVFNAALATGATAYLGSVVPAVAQSTFISALTTLAFVWALTAVNIQGVRAAGTVQVLTTVLKLLPLLAIGGLALWLFARRSPLVLDTGHAAIAPTLDGVTAAATLTLSALIGFESVAVMANKVRNPARNIPLATLIGTIATAAIYVLTCTAVMLLIPADKLAASSAPFADVARLFWGEGAARGMALFVMISALGCLNAGVLLQGEVPLQMARRGAFPRVFLRESAQGTPVAALCIGSTLVTILVLLNYQDSLVTIYEFMVLLATTDTLVLYLLCPLAMLALLRKGQVGAHGGYAAWLAAAAVVGTLYALWALVGAGAKAVLWGLVLLALGIPVFYLMKRAAAAEAAK
jgi:APA family basic amino acid/polyamine antiporter